jgi:hypothetical protein
MGVAACRCPTPLAISIEIPMQSASELLTDQFLAWVAERERTHADVMDAWRSSCPRFSIWEDAVIDGFVRIRPDTRLVELTPAGRRRLVAMASQTGADA